MDPVCFATAYVDLTRRRLEAPPVAPSANADPVDQVAPASQAEQPRFDPKLLARQAFHVLGSVVPAVAGGAPVALAVAAEVGRSLGESGVAQAEVKVRGSSGSPDLSLRAALPAIKRVFERVLTQSTARPELVPWGRPSEASALGQTVFVGQRLLRHAHDESKVAFILAHELAHVERRDSAGLLGVMALGEMVQDDVTSRQWETMERGYSHTVEFEADRRAAEMVARLGYDPLPILEMITHADHDGDHPAGLKRARVIRDVFAACGRPLSSADWKRLTKKGEG